MQSPPNLQKKKNIYIHLPKIKLYAKLTYCDYPNKIVEHPNLRITKIGLEIVLLSVIR